MAADDAFTTNESEQLAVGNPGVLTNDSDPDGDSLTAKISQPPQNGTLTLFPDGSFNYMPNGGGELTDSFQYTAFDGTANSSPATVSIAINVAPAANAGSDQTVNAGDSVQLDGSASSDPNTGDTLSYSWTQTAGDSVTLSSATTQSPTFTAPATAPQTLAFSVTVTDAGGLSDSDTVDIVINAPPVAGNTCFPTPVDTEFNGDLNGQVTDPDATSNELLYTQVTAPMNADAFSLFGNGTFSYTPGSGFRGEDEFEFQVEDSHGATSTGTVRIVSGKTRIMPLGDSITLGVRSVGDGSPAEDPESDNGGYRLGLFNRLDGAVGLTYQFESAGSQTDGGAAPTNLTENRHEGYGGFTADEVANGFDPSEHTGCNPGPCNHRGQNYTGILGKLNSIPTDVVLLHIGTNDINPDDPNDTIVDITTILDQIDAWESTNNPVTVFVAQIIERETSGGSFPNPNVETLNTMISDLVAGRPADQLVLVNQHDALGDDPVTSGDMNADGIHPTLSGYDKMGVTWFNALESWGGVLNCPDTF